MALGRKLYRPIAVYIADSMYISGSLNKFRLQYTTITLDPCAKTP